MADDETPQDAPPPPPGGQYPPNWGSAYPPPPPGGQYPPNYGSAYPPNYGSAYPPGGQHPPGYPQGYGAPKHPQATTAMILGIVGLTGVLCCVTAFAAPFAWWFGAKAVREIDASPAMYSGRSEASAGKIMGIIGTALMILGIVGIIALVVVGVASDSSYDSDYFIGGVF
ncbi:MAG: hypothetical protein JWQ70_1119 [Aeromicrobium sp.]|jgi:hypothetical protein|nr:hypothetical protein [Aeromicrobium sp.]